MTMRARLDAVTKRYGRHVALIDATLDIRAFEILGLIGPNGAGKTTLLRVLAGLIRPDAGIVTMPSLSTSADVRYFAGEHTLPPGVRARHWLRIWSASTASTATNRPMGALSRGTRHRVGLEAVLSNESPSLLLLDEPWEGLDPDASRWLSEELVKRRNAGAGVIVSSHRIHDLADVCDRCVFLVGGRLTNESVAADDFARGADRTALLFAAFDRAKQMC
jgi:ABC-2 type transport system ATP-binding protein